MSNYSEVVLDFVVKHDHSEVVLIFVKTVSAVIMYGVAVYVEELQTLYG